MPLILLILIALAAGLAVFAVARHPVGRSGRKRQTEPALRAATELGEHAGHHPHMRSAVATHLDAERTTGLALGLALVLIIGGGVVLGALALLVRSTEGLISIDSSVASWGDRHASATSTDGLTVVTRLGETWLVLAVGAVVAIVDRVRTASPWAAPFLLVVVVGEKLLVGALKDLVDRVRPAFNPIAETLGPSFPSGHTTTAATFWAAVALVAGRWVAPRGRAALAGLAVGIAVGVAASRVLLDVHWLTDVIGGLALGWAWFAVCAIAFGGRLLRFGAGTKVAEQAAQRTEHDDLAAQGGRPPPRRTAV